MKRVRFFCENLQLFNSLIKLRDAIRLAVAIGKTTVATPIRFEASLSIETSPDKLFSLLA